MKKNIMIIGSVILIVSVLIHWALNFPNKETIGYIGGIIGGISGFPHVIRVWQRKITIKASSWAVWGLCGIAQIITFVGDMNAFWPLIGNAFFPLVNLSYCLYYWREYKGKLDGWEWACMLLGVISISLYVLVHFVPFMSNEYANYLAIIADGCALMPTLFFVWKNPMQERPLPWFLFTMGMVFATIAITDGRLASYALPVYMSIGSMFVWLPLVIHRIKNNKYEWYGNMFNAGCFTQHFLYKKIPGIKPGRRVSTNIIEWWLQYTTITDIIRGGTFMVPLSSIVKGYLYLAGRRILYTLSSSFFVSVSVTLKLIDNVLSCLGLLLVLSPNPIAISLTVTILVNNTPSYDDFRCKIRYCILLFSKIISCGVNGVSVVLPANARIFISVNCCILLFFVIW